MPSESGDVKVLVLNLVNDATISLPDGTYNKQFSDANYNIFWKGRQYVEIRPKPRTIDVDGHDGVVQEESYGELGNWKVVVPLASCKKVECK